VSKSSTIAAPGQEFSHKKAQKAQKEFCVFCGNGFVLVHEIESFLPALSPKTRASRVAS
jgi:hypothetical protein